MLVIVHLAIIVIAKIDALILFVLMLKRIKENELRDFWLLVHEVHRLRLIVGHTPSQKILIWLYDFRLRRGSL